MSLRSSLPLFLGRLSAKLPPKADENLWRYLRLGKPVSLWRLEGKGRDHGQASMVYGGPEPKADFLVQRFFPDSFETTSLGLVPIRALRARLAHEARACPLVAARIDRALVSFCSDESTYRIPEWLNSSFPIPSDLAELARKSNSLRQDLRIVRKHQFSASESHDPQDLSRFYEEMYCAHAKERHGVNSQLRSFASVQYALQEGRRVAGMVLRIDKELGYFVAIGTLQGDEKLLKMGALSAAYQLGIDYLRSRGCTRVDLGGTRPCLSNGLLWYKAKWGAVLSAKPISPFDYVVKWDPHAPSVLEMLQAGPLVTREKRRLVALIAGATSAFPPDKIPAGVDEIRSVQGRIAPAVAPIPLASTP
jgi:hypothetical protein